MHRSDVIIVLGGGIRDDGELPENVVHRVKKAGELFKKLYASRIIMTGKWSQYRKTHRPKHTEAELMKRLAMEIQIPEVAILKEEDSYNTEENIQMTAKAYLEPNNWKRIIVVTSDIHLPRAKTMVDKHLNSNYMVEYVGTKIEMGFIKKIGWKVINMLLESNRFS